LKTISVDIMPTTSQIFGNSAQEHAAATFTSLGEAGPGQDLFGPYATLLNRKLSGYGGKANNIVQLASAPGQFVANAGYTAAQISDPNFGRKVYGSRYDQAYNALNDPSQVAPAYNALGGAVSFRGQAALKYKQKGDTMLDPKGNFYFDRNQDAYKKGVALLHSGSSPTLTSAANTNQQTGNIYNYYFVGDGETDTNKFLTSYLPKIAGITSKFDPISAVQQALFSTPNYFGEDSDKA
jgi:hypothetical protein